MDVKLPNDARTLNDTLAFRVREQGDQIGFTFLSDGERGEARLTFAELGRRAAACAAELAGWGCQPGDRALLLFSPGLDYVAAFLGCLQAGVIAVPAYPPDPARLQRTLPRLVSVVEDSRARLVLTSEMIARFGSLLVEHLPGWTADQICVPRFEGLSGIATYKATPESIAFLQYTSGSTSSPKGVEVTHGNLVHNAELIQESFGLRTDDVVVSWLPLYHDMGLIGTVLQPLFRGVHVVLMSPLHFLQRPQRWLSAIARFGGTISGGPNFAYDLCVRKIGPEERAALDLRRWRIAFNGAEPVREATLKAFSNAFAVSGFRPTAHLPCYGLAEGTLMVSGRAPDKHNRVVSIDASELAAGRFRATEGESETTLVSCGAVRGGQQVVIANPNTFEEAASGVVGEVWVRGGSVARGYWNRPDATRETFGAMLSDGRGPFLRTGDLGCLHDGELFITGRLKDLIIVRGRNLYPQDLEQTCEAHSEAVRPGCSAAFTVDVDDVEQLVVVCEVDLQRQPGATLEDVIDAIRAGLMERHDVAPYSIVLIEPQTILKTSAGKIRRAACRAAFKGSELQVLARTAPPRPSPALPPVVTAADVTQASPADRPELMLRLLAHRLVAATGHVVDTSRETRVSALGLDSLAAVELVHALETELGVTLEPADFLSAGTLGGWLESVAARMASEAEPQESRSARVGAAPATQGEAALWFLQRVQPENVAYNVPCAATIVGALDVPALERALAGLVERHDILRTTYDDVNGWPEPHTRSTRLALEVIDRAGAGDDELRAALSAAAAAPFDLAADIPVRASLSVISPERAVLLLVFHHIAVDMWSIVLLLRELGERYACEREGRALPPSQAAPYRAFARWQRDYLEGEQERTDARYWAEVVGDRELPSLDLPIDRPRPRKALQTAGAHRFSIEESLTCAIRDLASAHDTTPMVVLLTAYQVLLLRASRQREVIVGVTYAGRSRPMFGATVGYFVNVLPICADAGDDPSFASLLASTRAAVLGGLRHQDFPFSRLVSNLAQRGDPDRSPVYQAMFVVEQAHLPGYEALAGFARGERGVRLDLCDPLARNERPGTTRLDAEPFALDPASSQFDLTLKVAPTGQRIAAAIEYSSELFDVEHVASLTRCLQSILQSATADPRQRVSRIPLLPADEHASWPGTVEPRMTTPPSTLHGLVWARAERTPAAIAVEHDGETLTYAELRRRARDLACRLRALGAGVESRVGVWVERSFDLLVGVLGVLETGAAYVPLDPDYPDLRIERMIEDGRPTAFVVGNCRPLPGAPATRVLAINRPSSEPAPIDNGWHSPAGPDNLAYVFYTSGSTGRPKGVMVEHRAIVNRIHRAAQFEQLDATDRVLHKTPFGFDVSVWELFGPLTVGATLVMAKPGGHRDPDYLSRCGREARITLMHFVPSMLRAFLQHRCDVALPQLRSVVCSGESLDRDLVDLFHQHFDCTLTNRYGPTETAVEVSEWPCPSSHGRQRVPIGTPLANTRLYILDAALQPLPPGVAGELYIAGAQIGRGYHDLPGLTAARFLPDPWGPPGSRMYRSGDVARWRIAGNGVFPVEFLGRVDQQVKIRGVRIELEEIEAVLRAQPGIVAAAVQDQPDELGERRLVAFVLVEGAAPLDRDALRTTLSRQLPESMVPWFYQAVDDLPLTPSGKLDRGALPRLALRSSSRVAPRTPTEERVVAIWERVLGVADISVVEHFYNLGGHSLRAMQVMARVRDELGIDLPLRTLFADPTVAGLASAIDTARPDPSAHGAPAPIERQLHREERMLDELDNLSEEQLDALLAQHSKLDEG